MSNEVGEALERARVHFERATLEGLEAGRALLEAARHASGPVDGSGRSFAAEVLHDLEIVIARIREHAPIDLPRSFSEPLTLALDAEIERWERRARNDPDARTVLRAFLGLRELLWTLGVRGRNDPPSTVPETETRTPRDRGKSERPPRRRVQRFDVES